LSASLGRLLADAPADTAVVASLHAAALRVVRVAADQDRKGGADSSSSSSSSSSAAAAFALEPSVVAESSLRSLNYQSGILLLEEMLLVRRGDLSIAQAMATLQRARAAAHQAAHGPASAKAASTSSSRRGASSEAAATEGEGGGRGYDGANSDGWLQLSRLYAALGEKDVLVGLSLRAAQHEGTHEALRLELAGQHASAITCYNKLLTRQEQLLRKQKGGGGGGSGDEQEMQADEARVHGLERVGGGLGTA
jgi:hypothetical protein